MARGWRSASPTIKAGTWTGIVTDTIGGAADTEPTRVTENVKEHGALYAFIESKTQRVYVLNPQNAAAPYAGRAVSVKGTVDSCDDHDHRKFDHRCAGEDRKINLKC